MAGAADGEKLRLNLKGLGEMEGSRSETKFEGSVEHKKSTSSFGHKPAFGAFGSSSSQTTPFGSSIQQSQPAFGTSLFGSSQPSFGTATAPAYGAPSAPAFGVANTSHYGITAGAFSGVSSAPVFGSSSPAFGGPASTPAFGSTSTGIFGSSSASAPSFNFGSTPAPFGPAFGQQSTLTPAFGQLTGAFGSPFGTTTSPFGGQGNQFDKRYLNRPETSGTSLVALRYKGGVVNAGDSRSVYATFGDVYTDKQVKLYDLWHNIYVTNSGSNYVNLKVLDAVTKKCLRLEKILKSTKDVAEIVAKERMKFPGISTFLVSGQTFNETHARIYEVFPSKQRARERKDRLDTDVNSIMYIYKAKERNCVYGGMGEEPWKGISNLRNMMVVF